MTQVKKGKVVVGMSGGVDSTVSAFLLQQQGYDVIGVYMKNWEDDAMAQYRPEGGVGCSWEQDMADVRSACAQLGIPYMTFNFVKEYKERVFTEFVSELETGRTPNPDILCNQEIKFKLFFEKALEVPGVEFVATGHYAAIGNTAGVFVNGGGTRLMRPTDNNKDQTYFLHRVNPEHLPQMLFPLAGLTKPEVRVIAEDQGFVNADKKDSMGICFIGDIEYREFVQHYIQKKPGAIVLMNEANMEGVRAEKVIGQHDGLHLYTIGQRKGIDIGGTGPYYVAQKRMSDNALIVVNDSEDDALFTRECQVADMHWLMSNAERDEMFGRVNAAQKSARIEVQVRYRQEAQTAVVEVIGDASVQIVFDEPQRAVTPGQSAVIYSGDWCLGGGVIQ